MRAEMAPLQMELPAPLADVPTVERSFARDADRLVHEIRIGDRLHRSTVLVDPVHATDDPLGDWWHAYLRGLLPASDTKHAPALRVAELFSGPGGLALGFSQACAELGYSPRSLAAADLDAEALAVYRRHNQTRRVTTDSVAQLIDYRVDGEGLDCEFLYEPEAVEPAWRDLVGGVDVLLAGPPCQGHSNLNNRTRYSDRRNRLYLTAPAMAVALGAPIVMIENVRAVIHDRRQVVQSAEALLRRAGYEVTSAVVKAAEVGWPQRRERFFLVARRDRPPLPLLEVVKAFRDAPRDLWWAIGELEDEPNDGYMTQQPEFSAENWRRIDWLFDHGAFDLPPSERPDCHRDGTTYNAVYGRLYADRPAPTITTGFMTPGRGRYIHPTRRRVLTAREAARLQGFPDTYDFRPHPPAAPSKLKLGKWIGDAVPMPLGYLASVAALGTGWGD
jgi:DNA (cytosine-5)-methyltransferase 1